MSGMRLGALRGASGEGAGAWPAAPWRLLLAAAAVAVAAISMKIVFVGYVESDDLSYATAAEGWVRQAPFLGNSHWGIRHCIVLPMACLFWLFGRSETTLVLPSMAYAAAFLALLAHMAYRLHGWLAAVFVVAVAGSLPVIATGASLVSTDLPEAFFVTASAWLFYRAREGGRMRLFLASGLAAGCAVITRETTAALLLFYGIVAAMDRGRHGRGYAWAAAGFLLVALSDWAYLAAMSGDPLYRLHLALKGAHGDGPQMAALFAKRPGLDRFGSLDLPRWIKPLALLFLNQSFGLFFWLAWPATAWVALRDGEPARSASRLIGGLALVWLLVLGYVLEHWLWVIPRYFTVCVILAVPMAVWLARLAGGRRYWAAGAPLLLVLGSSMALNLGATTDLMAGEHALAAYAASSGEVIHADPATLRGAGWLLEIRHLEARVTATPPGPGSLYFFNSRPHRPLPAGWPIRSPQAGWIKLRGEQTAPKWTGSIAKRLGLLRLLPAGLREKLDPAPHVIALYRLPPEAP